MPHDRPSLSPFPARPPAPFRAGRESIWADDCPLIADGALLDLFHDAQAGTVSALTELNNARSASVEYLDRALARSEDDLRLALSRIATIRQRIASVPTDFGRDK